MGIKIFEHLRCAVKFENDNFEHLCLERIKNEPSPHLSCNLHKIGANLNSNSAYAPFCAKKYGPGWIGGWMVGWVGGKARLRIAYSNQERKGEILFKSQHITHLMHNSK